MKAKGDTVKRPTLNCLRFVGSCEAMDCWLYHDGTGHSHQISSIGLEEACKPILKSYKFNKGGRGVGVAAHLEGKPMTRSSRFDRLE